MTRESNMRYGLLCRLRQLHRQSVLRCLFLVPLLMATPLLATTTAKAFDPSVAERIDADVQTILNRTGTPGAVIAIVDDGEIVYRKAYGLKHQ